MLFDLFINNFKKAGLRMPTIHKAWFSDLTPEDVPENIMFAFFDGDFYESIADSFRVCEDKFSEGAVVVIDDYANEALPGAQRAVDDWCRRRGRGIDRVEASLTIIRL